MKKRIQHGVLLLGIIAGLAAIILYATQRGSFNWRLTPVVQGGKLNVRLLRKTITHEFERGEDPQTTYEYLKRFFSTYDISIQHQSAHVFGEVLFEQMGTAGIRVCDSDFAFGCFHSLFGKAIAALGIGVVSQLEQGCIEAYGPGGLGCVHGIGHGLGEYFGQQNIKKQLEICSKLSWKGTLFGCSDGVFMEYHFPSDVQAAQITTGVMPVAPGDEYDPCVTAGSLYERSCYFSLPTWWVDALKKDEVRMNALCGGLSDDDSKRFCFLGVGYAIAPVLDYDTQETQRRCDHMTGDDNQLLCRAGAAFAFFVNEQERPRASGMCEGLGERVSECVQTSQLLLLQEL